LLSKKSESGLILLLGYYMLMLKRRDKKLVAMHKCNAYMQYQYIPEDCSWQNRCAKIENEKFHCSPVQINAAVQRKK
jgi:hypothetical protein